MIQLTLIFCRIWRSNISLPHSNIPRPSRLFFFFAAYVTFDPTFSEEGSKVTYAPKKELDRETAWERG